MKLKLSFLVLLISLLMPTTIFASQWDWASMPGHHNQSILLGDEYKNATDSIYRYARGEYLAEGTIKITNEQNGDIGIDVDTLSYVNADRIIHTVFLDVWDDINEDWVQVGYWNFEKTKAEAENGELYLLSTSITASGYGANKYYRVRGLHGVEYHDELEACATETNGVLITD